MISLIVIIIVIIISIIIIIVITGIVIVIGLWTISRNMSFSPTFETNRRTVVLRGVRVLVVIRGSSVPIVSIIIIGLISKVIARKSCSIIILSINLIS